MDHVFDYSITCIKTFYLNELYDFIRSYPPDQNKHDRNAGIHVGRQLLVVSVNVHQ